jgi:hypothetical protein
VQLPLDPWLSLSVSQRIQYEVATLVAITNAPLDIVENPAFHRAINAFVDIGRSEPHVRIGSEECKLTRSHTRKIIINRSQAIHEYVLTKFAQMPCVSLAIDASTIERRHILDIIILAPYSKIRPFLYGSIEESTLTAEDYGNIVTEAIKDLFQKNVHVRSIVGDNLPAQVSALAHWSSHSHLKQGEELYLHGIKYSPCMCHFIQLIVGDLISRGSLYNFEELLQEMITAVNHSEVRKITHSRCPYSIKTRWLSRDESLTWLLSREELLLHMNVKLISKSRRAHIRAIFTESNFKLLSIYHRMLHPFTQAVKLFEEDRITLCHVYPALKTLKKYFLEEANSHTDSNPEYSACCASVLPIVQQRQRKLLDRDLLKAAFWLTSFGCQSLSNNCLFIPTLYQLTIKYHTPPPITLIQGSFSRIMQNVNCTLSRDDEEQEEADYSYTGHEIPEEELEEAPKTHGYRNQVLTFVIEYLSVLMLEDLDTDTANNVYSEVRHQVEESLQFFFCNPESIAKCRDTCGSVEKEVELWNWMKYTSQGRINEQLTLKVISIVSIPASEASCERSFSRQKRIMNHLRTRSNPELLRARFLLESSNN